MPTMKKDIIQINITKKVQKLVLITTISTWIGITNIKA